MTSSAVRLLTGRRTKCLVLVFWLVVVALAGPLAGKLTGAEKNDAAVLAARQRRVDQGAADCQQAFQSPNAFPAVVVYERPSGLTAGRPGQGRGRRRSSSPASTGVQGKPIGPIPSPDGKALQTVVPFDLGYGRLEAGAGHRRPDPRTIAGSAPAGLTVHVTGPGRLRGRLRVRRSRASTARCCSPRIGVVVIILLLTYRSPMLWLLPVISRRRRADRRPGASSTCWPRTPA